jgi:hypothetical protein
MPPPKSWSKDDPVEKGVEVLLHIYENVFPFMVALRRLFDERHNALAAWQAYAFARERKIRPIPEWILKYFDDVAHKMLYTATTVRDLSWCLDLGPDSGGPSKFAQHRMEMIRLLVVRLVQQFVDKEELTVDGACEKAAKIVNAWWPKEHEGEELDSRTIFHWYYDLTKEAG